MIDLSEMDMRAGGGWTLGDTDWGCGGSPQWEIGKRMKGGEGGGGRMSLKVC